jgi:hypothetical protein
MWESPVVVMQAGNKQGKEVRPEDKMATNSQNGDIITLSTVTLSKGLQV